MLENAQDILIVLLEVFEPDESVYFEFWWLEYKVPDLTFRQIISIFYICKHNTNIFTRIYLWRIISRCLGTYL